LNKPPLGPALALVAAAGFVSACVSLPIESGSDTDNEFLTVVVSTDFVFWHFLHPDLLSHVATDGEENLFGAEPVIDTFRATLSDYRSYAWDYPLRTDTNLDCFGGANGDETVRTGTDSTAEDRAFCETERDFRAQYTYIEENILWSLWLVDGADRASGEPNDDGTWLFRVDLPVALPDDGCGWRLLATTTTFEKDILAALASEDFDLSVSGFVFSSDAEDQPALLSQMSSLLGFVADSQEGYTIVCAGDGSGEGSGGSGGSGRDAIEVNEEGPSLAATGVYGLRVWLLFATFLLTVGSFLVIARRRIAGEFP
jgi:hypothetical protein